MKVQFTKDDKQEIVTIKQNDNKVILRKDDFNRICNYGNGTYSDVFNKTQWRVTSDTSFKKGNYSRDVVMVAKDKKITFNTNNIPPKINW